MYSRRSAGGGLVADPEKRPPLAEWITQRGLDALAESVYVYNSESTLVAGNAAAEVFWKVPNAVLIDQFRLSDNVATLGQDLVDLFFRAVNSGERVSTPPLPLHVSKDDDLPVQQNMEVWLQIDYVPLRDNKCVHYVMGIGKIVTDDVKRASAIAEAEEKIELQSKTIASLEEANQEIERQRAMIHELSSPVIDVWGDVLLIPLVGSLERERAGVVAERVLASITQRQSVYAIMDLTGVPDLDTGTADHLMRIAKMIKLLGAECIVAGIQPMVAQTITNLELSLGDMRVFQALRDALEYCMAKSEKRSRK